MHGKEILSYQRHMMTKLSSSVTRWRAPAAGSGSYR
jgi:hypothetical protein